MGRMKRAGALLLCVAFVMTLFVSSAYLVHEAGHTHCTEEDCPVCRTIAMTSGLMRALFLAVALLCLARAAAALTARRMPERAFRSAFGTPVSLKIRLND